MLLVLYNHVGVVRRGQVLEALHLRLDLDLHAIHRDNLNHVSFLWLEQERRSRYHGEDLRHVEGTATEYSSQWRPGNVDDKWVSAVNEGVLLLQEILAQEVRQVVIGKDHVVLIDTWQSP